MEFIGTLGMFMLIFSSCSLWNRDPEKISGSGINSSSRAQSDQRTASLGLCCEGSWAASVQSSSLPLWTRGLSVLQAGPLAPSVSKKKKKLSGQNWIYLLPHSTLFQPPFPFFTTQPTPVKTVSKGNLGFKLHHHQIIDAPLEEIQR